MGTKRPDMTLCILVMNLNPCILRMLEVTFSFGAVHMNKYANRPQPCLILSRQGSEFFITPR